MKANTGKHYTALHYYAFGMVMPSREYYSGRYRFGYNGKEKDDEMKGTGNSYTSEFRQYDPRLGRWLSIDPLAQGQPSYAPYKALFNNPIFWIDPSGGTEEERIKAVEAAQKNIGKKYGEAIPGGGQFDCSGLVRNSMMQNKTISDPFTGTTGNGVSRIMSVSTQIKSVDDIEVGNVVVIKSGGNVNGHIMLITEVTKDNGKVISYKVVHAEQHWENEKLGISGGGNVNETTIHTDGNNRKGETYSKSKYEHRFYKWDTPDPTEKIGNTSDAGIPNATDASLGKTTTAPVDALNTAPKMVPVIKEKH